jgi:FixJ family two-component response regulator
MLIRLQAKAAILISEPPQLLLLYEFDPAYPVWRCPEDMEPEMPDLPLIAVVDDDHAVRDATSQLLRSLGYRTATFDSVDRFFASPHHADCSCVITDVKMPGRSGLDLQAELRARGQWRPVIFLTAFPDLCIEARALADGAFAFLIKPCREDVLAECVEAAIARG